MRRTFEHCAALVHERVASADGGANWRHEQPAFSSHLQDFAKRYFKVLLDVIAQRFERRNVEDLGAITEGAVQSLAHQAVNASEERGECLAGAGRRGNQCSVAGENMRPALFLRLGRGVEFGLEPL